MAISGGKKKKEFLKMEVHLYQQAWPVWVSCQILGPLFSKKKKPHTFLKQVAKQA